MLKLRVFLDFSQEREKQLFMLYWLETKTTKITFRLCESRCFRHVICRFVVQRYSVYCRPDLMSAGFTLVKGRRELIWNLRVRGRSRRSWERTGPSVAAFCRRLGDEGFCMGLLQLQSSDCDPRVCGWNVHVPAQHPTGDERGKETDRFFENLHWSGAREAGGHQAVSDMHMTTIQSFY